MSVLNPTSLQIHTHVYIRYEHMSISHYGIEQRFIVVYNTQRISGEDIRANFTQSGSEI